MERLRDVAARGASALRNAQPARRGHRARHGPLTGLPNRSLLCDRLSEALARSRRSRALVGVLIATSPGIKESKDVHGHTMGDEVLAVAADRLCRALRGSDTVARMGGDEFTIVVPDIPDVSACYTVSNKLLAELGRVIEVDGHAFAVTARIGTTVGCADDSYDTLTNRADVAVCHAK